ncbi:Uncharacterized protein APZ42_027504 [Daphnia magna]|uniref:Uncharacterized protein n=1 Tax=Daphnia magna TaxID=35525 RepID=A0A164RMJ0_9CRUS|nr:Uncharacterized protein APZ42_027504 [Daphnia magna]
MNYIQAHTHTHVCVILGKSFISKMWLLGSHLPTEKMKKKRGADDEEEKKKKKKVKIKNGDDIKRGVIREKDPLRGEKSLYTHGRNKKARTI